MFRKSVREFVDREVKPHVGTWEEAGVVPRELFARLASLGFLGVRLSEEYGGSGLDFWYTTVLVQELAVLKGYDLVLEKRDGLVYRNTDYEITVTAPDGTIERVITRPHEARRRTAEELEELSSGMSMNINGRVPEIVQKLQDNAPCITALYLQDDGTLWVENSHARDRWDDEGIVTYDVFGPDGRLDREVTVRIPGGGEDDRLVLLADGRFLLAVGQADLSISIRAGNGDGELGDAPVAAIMPELVCFGANR